MITGRRAAREATLLVMFAAEATGVTKAEEALLMFADHLRDDEELLHSLFVEEGEADPDAVITRASSLLNGSSPHWQFTVRLVTGAMGHIAALDTLISKYSRHWKIGRMSRVDRNVLRQGTYELAFESDVPVRATLNEAIELAKRYGSEDSGKFVNGILDRIAQELGRV